MQRLNEYEHQMQITTNYVLQAEEKLYVSNKTCLELLEQVRELDT